MRPDTHMLVGAYALDALADHECATFQRHLAACAACRAEAAGLAATAARLAAAAAEQPPPGLRESVLRSVAQTRPDAPGRSPESWQPLAKSREMLAAAAILLLALTIGGLIEQRQRADLLADQQQQITAILSAPDAKSADTRLGGGRLTVVASNQLDRAVVSARGLPPLDGAETYQLWWVAGGQASSAGLLDLEQADDGTTMILDDLADARLLAVTVEPAGGSQRPTPPIVATTKLT